MTIFLFLKQIVDVLYPYKWLDYMMVCLVIFLLAYQILLVRPSIRKNFTVSDGIVLACSLLLTVSFLKNMDGYGIYFKVLSAFLMFFVGRVYYDRIQECYGALVTSSYLVIYANFIYRLANNGFTFGTGNAGGDLYYYDTDMAFAMILGMVFIGMLGKNTLRKLFTIGFVCPCMVLYSDAGIQKVVLSVVYIILFLYIAEKVSGKRKAADWCLTMIVVALLVLIAIFLLPVFTDMDIGNVLKLADGSSLSQENMLGRYRGWREIWEYLRQGSRWKLLFGTDLCSESLHNSVFSSMNSLYMKTLYSLGISGIMLLVAFVVSVIYYVIKVKDRKTFYITVILAVMLLTAGMTVSSMEATQMSWFPMMFAGMVISSVQVEKRERYQVEQGAEER